MKRIPIVEEVGRGCAILGYVEISEETSKKMADAMGELVIAPSEIWAGKDANTIYSFTIRPETGIVKDDCQ